MHTQVSSNATVLNTASGSAKVEKIKHTMARAHTNNLFYCIRGNSYVVSYGSLNLFWSLSVYSIEGCWAKRKRRSQMGTRHRQED